jgi:hypothetical protein
MRKFGLEEGNTTLPLKSFYRDINLAFRSMREGYCAKGTEPLTKQVRRNRWMITEEGLAQTLGHRKTLTARWLASKPPQFHQAIQNALRAKMPQSSIMGLIQDHHSSVMLKWITRDAFKERIEANKPPSDAECCCWAVRSAYTDIRGDGRDAIGVVRGAKTATMRVKAQKDEQALANATVLESPQYQDPCAQTCIQEGELDFIDIMSGDPAHCVEMKEMLGAMIHAIQCNAQGAADCYIRIFKMHYLDGQTIQAISSTEGIAYSRANAIVKEISQIIHQARQSGGLDWSPYQTGEDVYSLMESASDRN